MTNIVTVKSYNVHSQLLFDTINSIQEVLETTDINVNNNLAVDMIEEYMLYVNEEWDKWPQAFTQHKVSTKRCDDGITITIKYMQYNCLNMTTIEYSTTPAQEAESMTWSFR